MFCSHCGKEATGKFCWNCGAPLHAGAGKSQPAPPTPAADWQNEVGYEKLLHNPEVRDLFVKQQPATSRMTGEQFADSFGKILQSPVSLGPIMGVMQDVYGRLGIHTGKTRSQSYRQPVGRVISIGFVRSGQGWIRGKGRPSGVRGLHADLRDSVRHVQPRRTDADHDSARAGGFVSSREHTHRRTAFRLSKSNRCLDQLFNGIETPHAEAVIAGKRQRCVCDAAKRHTLAHECPIMGRVPPRRSSLTTPGPRPPSRTKSS